MAVVSFSQATKSQKSHTIDKQILKFTFKNKDDYYALPYVENCGDSLRE